LNINTSKKNVAIYLRVSTKDQENNTSLTNQLKIAKKFCEQNDLIYSDDLIYKDTSSASPNSKSKNLIETYSTSRPEFNRLLSDALQGKFSTVVVYSHDRLSRNIYESMTLKTYLERLKIDIRYCKSGEQFDSKNEAMNNFFENLLNNIAEFESTLIGKRVKLGNQYNVQHNYWPGGPTPYGYSLINLPNTKRKSILIVKNFEAKLVEEIFELYALGNSPEFIATIIKDKYKDETTRKWTKNSIISILNNEIYNGTIVWNKKGGARNPRKNPKDLVIKSNKIKSIQIISDDLWNTVQKIKEKVTHNSKILSTPFILKDLLICSNCGKYLDNKNYGYKKGRVYFCKCNNSEKWEYSIKANLIEKEVFNKLKTLIYTLLKEESNFQNFYTSYHERLFKKKQQYESSKVELEKELSEISETLLKCAEIIEESNLISTPSTTNERKSKLVLNESIGEFQSYLALRKSNIEKRLAKEKALLTSLIPTKDMIRETLLKNHNLLDAISKENNNDVYNNTLRLLVLDFIDCISINKNADNYNIEIIIK